jgi:hypothetical protein
MKCWKKLECEDYHNINIEILDWINSQETLKNPTSFWNPIDTKKLLDACPKFYTWLNNRKIYLSSIAVTYGTDVDCCQVHIDTPPARFKLSWPVKNTKGSWNRWFNEIVPQDTFVNSLGGTQYRHGYSNLTEFCRKEVTEPCLIDAGIPHDVWFDNKTEIHFPRIGLQCQLIKEPTSL